MGLFGPKLPPEEKEYVKALKKASSLSVKSNDAMLAAVEKYPTGWQGYWYIALFYDFAPQKGGVMNSQKAQEYFMKAEAAAKGTNGEEWLQNFLLWYNRPAGNVCRDISERYNKVRRLAVALLYNYTHGQSIVAAPYNGDDHSEFSSLLSNCHGYDELVSNYENDAFQDYFRAYNDIDWKVSHEDRVKSYNKMDRATTEAIDCYKKCVEREEKGKEARWDKFKDTYILVWGYCFLHNSPFITEEARLDCSEAAFGIKLLYSAAKRGNQTAIHELVRIANTSEENHQLMERTLRMDNETLVVTLIRMLQVCIEKRSDDEAIRLTQLYYLNEQE